jgi:hypothetical protein
MTVDEDVATWIRTLSGRVERGDLTALPPVDIGYGTAIMAAERTIRIMLADLDSFDELASGDRVSPETERCRAVLLDDFRRLRELIG